MSFYRFTLLAAVAGLLTGAMAIDLTMELNSGWKMGLHRRQAAQNLQSFSGSLGGVGASAISNSGDPDRPFAVDGDTFNDFKTAGDRSCDNQKNNCAEIANNGGPFEVGDCDRQNEQCKASIGSATLTSFAAPALVSSDAQFDFFCDVSAKTSPSTTVPSHPAAPARDEACRTGSPELPQSPALSTTSTADCGLEFSPVLHSLPAPALPNRALGFLRTPPPAADLDELDDNPFVTASWGSPYPRSHQEHLRHSSDSSEASDEYPIHHLAIQTPFLRPPPPELGSDDDPADQSSYTFVSAAVLANRARRPTRGLTEDWIRQHTATDNVEARHWLSDGTEDSEPSSLSGSYSDWLEPHGLQTPRANPRRSRSRQISGKNSTTRSSVDTLTPETLAHLSGSPPVRRKMATANVDQAAPATTSGPSQTLTVPEHVPVPATPPMLPTSTKETNSPKTPSKANMAKAGEQAPLHRPRKKVPWKGKNILVLLPIDDDRGQPGKAPKPMSRSEVEGMYRSWEELGYSIRGFDLDRQWDESECETSQSRPFWPSEQELDGERREGKVTVMLPDLNAWKNYVDDLNEAKLRALGVSSHEEEASPLPSISPVTSNASRNPSSQHVGQPFSPPIPPSSASSSHFPFPAPFMPNGISSAVASPGIPSTASPSAFAPPGKYNPRQSISIPASSSPFQIHSQGLPQNWAQQALLLQSASRGESPLSLNGLISPSSPFPPSGSPGFNTHQRHQSLQYPLLPHQQMSQFSRGTPVLQELQEVDEDTLTKSPSKTPEPSAQNLDTLQAEIDDAEYHLEEQLRHELEHEDYSPHNENDMAGESVGFPGPAGFPTSHARQQSVQYALSNQMAHNSGPGPVLHHPRPHSRGHSLTHSLSQNFFMQHEERRDSIEATRNFGHFSTPSQGVDESYEIQTNPSNLGTPVQDFDLASVLQQNTHQRGFSNSSNPWSNPLTSGPAARRQSHASKTSVSTLNVEAPEFKFNPQNTFQPSKFVFGGSSFEPQETIIHANPAFQGGPLSGTSSQFSLSTTSKINANAPVFSPGQSDFSFSASGPKFRPDAPAFTPFGSGFSDAVTSPPTGSEAGDKRASSIFGNIEIPASEFRPAKKSKAIPIVRPPSRSSSPSSPVDGIQEDADGRLIDESRVKRARASGGHDGDDVPLFAEPSEPKTLTSPSPVHSEKEEFQDVSLQPLSGDEGTGLANTSMSSMFTSEVADAKPTAPTSVGSPAETSPRWESFEFSTNAEMQSFSNALPPGEKRPFSRGHKKSLSATAKPFQPGAVAYREDDVSDHESLHSEDKRVEVDEDTPVIEDEAEEQADLGKEIQESATGMPEEPIAEHVDEPESPLRSSTPAPSQRVAQGLAASRFASPPPKPKGLAASRFASSPTPEPLAEQSPLPVQDDGLEVEFDVEEGSDALGQGERSPASGRETPVFAAEESGAEQMAVPEQGAKEPTFEEIDAVMMLINESDPHKGVNRFGGDSPHWHQPSPTRHVSLAAVTNESPFHLPPSQHFRSDAPSPSPRHYRALPDQASLAVATTEIDDPFVDDGREGHSYEGAIHHLNAENDIPLSEWDEDFSDAEHEKLESRVQFFDGRVNDVVGNIVATRLDPVERSLDSIQRVLESLARRERRSVSQESDADDEDDEPAPRRSMSPQRNRRAEQIRTAVLDALVTHQRATPAIPSVETPAKDSQILATLQEMKEHFSSSMRLDFRGEDLRNIVEEAVTSRMPPTPTPDTSADTRLQELEARAADLEQRLHDEQARAEKEIADRRAAQDRAAALERKLEAAETKVEMEIFNRSAFDQRVTDLEEELQQHKTQIDEELKGRRAAEDRLSEVQRLLRIASEEETRLRENLDDRDQRIKQLDQANSKATMRLALLDAAQTSSAQSQSDLTNKINAMEGDLKASRQDVNHWRLEAEHAMGAARRFEADLNQALGEKKQLHRLLATLGTQLEENERMRENWRAKFNTLEDDMARAAAQITEENARRTKKEQAMIARQEVLDARLQAEARTRERLEAELERLEGIERQGMRAVTESKRLETLLAEMRTENHQIQQKALRHQREFEEARESGASEVQRVRVAMQAQLDDANNHVNVMREELEDQISNLRTELDHAKLDIDSAKAQTEMLLEEAQSTHAANIQKLTTGHLNEVEDLHIRHERELSTAVDDAQTREEQLLERLSLSTSRTEHLQDRIIHLEEKLEIAKEAARAAAQAAKAPSADTAHHATSTHQQQQPIRSQELPEKISPQALRESIMVLQEQLQQREQTIEELEQKVADLDPDASTKIAKRDDEITWLRELLAVRHGDLQDIIVALSAESVDRDRLRDAVIRLKANLQMEEQERERAMNGGSAVSLPNIAHTIREAATPRVAQAVGPIAAAWGNWRKNQQSFTSLSGVLSSPAAASPRNHTPSKASISSQNSTLLGGLLTPPASGLRQTPPTTFATAQPTAFTATGRRYTGQRGEGSGRASISKRSEKMPAAATPPRHVERPQPVTPPMMDRSGYDSDANPGDFDDHGFFED